MSTQFDRGAVLDRVRARAAARQRRQIDDLRAKVDDLRATLRYSREQRDGYRDLMEAAERKLDRTESELTALRAAAHAVLDAQPHFAGSARALRWLESLLLPKPAPQPDEAQGGESEYAWRRRAAARRARRAQEGKNEYAGETEAPIGPAEPVASPHGMSKPDCKHLSIEQGTRITVTVGDVHPDVTTEQGWLCLDCDTLLTAGDLAEHWSNP